MENTDLANTFFGLFRNFKQHLLNELKLSDLDITFMHFLVLKESSLLDVCTAQSLAEAISRDKAQITRLLKELISKELMSAVSNPNDKRSKILSITPKGATYLAKFNQAEAKIMGLMVSDMNDKDVRRWKHLTQQMARNLAESD